MHSGCDTTLLVGVTLRTKGSNTQTTSVMAIVEYPSVGQPSVVKLAEIK